MTHDDFRVFLCRFPIIKSYRRWDDDCQIKNIKKSTEMGIFPPKWGWFQQIFSQLPSDAAGRVAQLPCPPLIFFTSENQKQRSVGSVWPKIDKFMCICSITIGWSIYTVHISFYIHHEYIPWCSSSIPRGKPTYWTLPYQSNQFLLLCHPLRKWNKSNTPL